MDVYSAVKTIGDSGLEYVEIWGELPHAYPEWVDRRRLKDVLSTYKMLVTTHAPFTELNPATLFQPIKGAVERVLEDFISLSEYLGATMVTFHPGSIHNESLVSKSVQNSISTLKRLVHASGGRLAINVENQAKGDSHYHFPIGSNMESLELILDEVEGLGFTLDTGHAHVNGQNPLRLAERLESKLSEVHLSDNSGTADQHLIPGEGNAPLSELWANSSVTRVPICLELDPHRYSEEQVVRAATEWKARR
jgi:sugar phosphate isomerase/epimerase